jgi:TM2 domain-containing membrane protein YozV
MSDTSAYPLRWRGRETGPYTVAEINRKLDEHEIGTGHEIQYQDKWISVEEFLAALKSDSDPAAKPARPQFLPPADDVMPRSARAVGPESITGSPRSAEQPKRSSQAPPRLEGRSRAAAAVARPRNRIVYAMLAILLGFTGFHNFYARHWMTGLFQLILTVTTYLLGFGIIATWVWALVEAVVIRKDGYGTEMR